MNPGFVSIWILTIFIILSATGWSHWVGAANANWRTMIAIGSGCIALQPLQHSLAVSSIAIDVHASSVYITIAALASVRGNTFNNSKLYLSLGSLLTGVIWGSIQTMYNADPVFYWIDPRWDAPLLGGLLAAAFSTKAQHQFAVLVLSAFVAEMTIAVMSGGEHTAHIGQLPWWDGFWLAFALSRGVSIVFSAARFTASKYAVLLWKNKRADSD
ncbi:hypothetical protein [Paenibacillus sp. NEAU-GSW1]|uniref:YphA family membrane protein n=1 Tax=Paenibacillus sp. NEAU-GSW1 TaxID=2682486 RepID=UPI0012E1E3CA|nr:hypothetical protein [Paenibacillus sp. NEAU-GSW1]MUT65501.1 hypothetical protein [Paenibacillus sp. NEAU-GSW1]